MCLLEELATMRLAVKLWAFWTLIVWIYSGMSSVRIVRSPGLGAMDKTVPV